MVGKFHIVCSGCDRVNRISETADVTATPCSLCRQPLFHQRVPELGDTSLWRHIERSDIPVVVAVVDHGTARGRIYIESVLPEIARRLEPRVRVVRVDAECRAKLARRFGVGPAPAILMFRNGAAILTESAASVEPAELIRRLESVLAPAIAA
jgi:thioredoxin 2